MRNNSNRKSQKPAARYNETVIENEIDVRLLNTWDGVSLIVYLYDLERKAMWQTFRFQMPDIDVRIKDFLLCVDTGRAMGQCFRRDRGVQIDVELRKVADGISMLLHIVTLFTDDGYARYSMPARDEDGTFRMVDGKHVMVPATLTFERLFPENRLQKLHDTCEDLLAGMLLRRIRRTLRSRGDQKTLGDLGRSLEFFLEEAEKAPVAPKLTASAGEILASKEGRKGQGQKKPKIGAPKAADSPKENAVDPASEYVEQVFAAATPVAASTPAADESSFAEVMTPVPVSATPAAPASKPKKDKIRATPAPRPSLADQVAAVRDQVLPGASDDSNGQK